MFWKSKKRKSIANVIEDKCRNCRYCNWICRHKVLVSTVVNGKLTTVVNAPEKCSGCGKCVANCPENAIKMVER